MILHCGSRTLDLRRPQIMGILNVTPDSFSDGGQFVDPAKAIQHAAAMMADGASVIDVGGESTRPGASPVTTEEELARVIPAVEGITAQLDVTVSVDTSNPVVIREAALAGAHLINDVRALQREGALTAAAATGLPVCLMHMQGSPESMQKHPRYDDVIQEVRRFLSERADAARNAGIDASQILLDPGFGFGKNHVHNYTLLNRLDQIGSLGYPLLTGLSRKRMIAEVLPDGADRDPASATAAALCAMKGARILRVHNVKATSDAISVLTAMMEEGHE